MSTRFASKMLIYYIVWPIVQSTKECVLHQHAFKHDNDDCFLVCTHVSQEMITSVEPHQRLSVVDNNDCFLVCAQRSKAMMTAINSHRHAF